MNLQSRNTLGFLAVCISSAALLVVVAVAPDYVVRRIEVAIATPIINVAVHVPTHDLPVCATASFPADQANPRFFADCTPPTLTPAPSVIPHCPRFAPAIEIVCIPATATMTPVPTSFATPTPAGRS